MSEGVNSRKSLKKLCAGEAQTEKPFGVHYMDEPEKRDKKVAPRYFQKFRAGLN